MDMHPFNEVPTLQDELNRKTIATVESLILRHEQGRLTDAMFQVALKTVFNVVSGLVDQDIIEGLSEAGAGGEAGETEIRVLMHSDPLNIVLIQRNLMTDQVVIQTNTQDGTKARMMTKDFASDGSAKAKAFVIDAVGQLVRRGYKVIW